MHLTPNYFTILFSFRDKNNTFQVLATHSIRRIIYIERERARNAKHTHRHTKNYIFIFSQLNILEMKILYRHLHHLYRFGSSGLFCVLLTDIKLLCMLGLAWFVVLARFKVFWHDSSFFSPIQGLFWPDSEFPGPFQVVKPNSGSILAQFRIFDPIRELF